MTVTGGPGSRDPACWRGWLQAWSEVTSWPGLDGNREQMAEGAWKFLTRYRMWDAEAKEKFGVTVRIVALLQTGQRGASCFTALAGCGGW